MTTPFVSPSSAAAQVFLHTRGTHAVLNSTSHRLFCPRLFALEIVLAALLGVPFAAQATDGVAEINIAMQTRVMNSEDRKEGVKAFAKRSKVDWPRR